MFRLRPACFALFVLLAAQSAHAADGNLDPSFGNGGKLTPNLEPTALAFYPDGRLLIGDGGGSFVISRLHPDGALDTTLDGDGTVTTSGDDEQSVSDLVILPDERFVAVGYALDGYDYFMRLIRYNADGSIDTTYGTAGKVTTTFAGGAVSGHAVLQPDGKVLNLAIAKYGGGLTYAIILARFNEDGSLDASFGTGGKVVTDFPGTGEYGTDVILAPGGQFYVIGVLTTDVGGGEHDSDWLILRYNADGSLDPTYGSFGRVVDSFYGQYNYETPMGAALQPDGKLVVGGDSGAYISLARYTAGGVVDISFGDWGRVQVLSFPEVQAGGMVRRADGKLIVAVTSYRAPEDVFSPNSFGLMAFDADGDVDTSFAACPQVTTSFGANDAHVREMGLQPDGKVVVVGGLENGSGAIARYGTAVTPVCQGATSGRSSLYVRDAAEAKSDLLKWKWSGEPVSVSDFGDPLSSAGYTLCVLDGNGSNLRLGSPMLRHDWSPSGGGFRFKTRSDNDFPFKKAKLNATTSGKGKIRLIGKGEYLHPSLPLTTPVTARLVRDDSETCWEATYSSALANDGQLFLGRSD